MTTQGFTRASRSNQPLDLDRFMATIRKLESGSYQGDYSQVSIENGERFVGAYSVPERYWTDWAADAGLAGASWRDPRAQDRVVAQRFQRYMDGLGSWDLVAAAWMGGTESVRRLVQRGYSSPSDVQNPRLRQYLEDFQVEARQAPAMGTVSESSMRQRNQNRQVTRAYGGWVNPVAGPNEYSRGSWMPTSKTHRGRTHAAIDVYAEKGTPIVSPVAGKVLSTKYSKIGGYTARIQGDDGITYYMAHMADSAVVSAGQRLRAGQHVGYVGNTGSAKRTKPHLHFSMKRSGGEVINPYSYLSGSEEASSQGIAPMGEVFARQGDQPTVGTMMNDILVSMSDQVAGGTRDPSVYRRQPERSINLGDTDELEAETPATGAEMKTTTEVTP